jgi:heat shock factor-binding protein 1
MIRVKAGEDARQELTTQLEDLLNTLSNKFAGVSSEIFAKSMFIVTCCASPISYVTVDEMSRRLDSLESQLSASKDDNKS